MVTLHHLFTNTNRDMLYGTIKGCQKYFFYLHKQLKVNTIIILYTNFIRLTYI